MGRKILKYATYFNGLQFFLIKLHRAATLFFAKRLIVQPDGTVARRTRLIYLRLSLLPSPERYPIPIVRLPIP